VADIECAYSNKREIIITIQNGKWPTLLFAITLTVGVQ